MFHWYGVFIAVGVVAAMWIATQVARSFGVDSKKIDDAVGWMIVPAIIGARGYHVLTDWELYAGAPLWEMIAVWHGGLGIFGALLGGLVGIAIVAYRQSSPKRVDTWWTTFFRYADLFAIGVPVGQAIGRLGNFVNQELYGTPTNLPWGLQVGAERVHPLFAYEAILLLILFAFLWKLQKSRAFVIGKGQYAALYLAGYGLIRFWLEFLRIDSATVATLSLFTIAQWVSLLLIALGAVIFWTRRHAVGVSRSKAWDFTLE